MAKTVKAVILSPGDHVATLLGAVNRDDLIGLPSGDPLSAREDMDIYFKVCIRSVRRGEVVCKYGQAIGEATANIEPGEKVHIHNLRSRRAVTED
ncbi:MAG: UxaA family hydrolase [Rhodospirillales bacterium]